MVEEAERLNIEVLIADDDPISRDILQAFLEALGCRVLIANDGIQAIRAANACADWIDAIVLDAYMPGPEPSDLYEQVREASPGVPILFRPLPWGYTAGLCRRTRGTATEQAVSASRAS